MVQIINRAGWGAKTGPPHTVPMSEKRYFFVHWHGNPPAADRGRAMAKDIEAIHLGNGWNGVGYSFMVGQDGIAYEGRGWQGVAAACPGYNRSGVHVYVAVGKGGPSASRAALSAVADLYAQHRRRLGRAPVQTWHGAHYGTECPGDELISWVKSGGLNAGTAGGSAGGTSTEWLSKMFDSVSDFKRAVLDAVAGDRWPAPPDEDDPKNKHWTLTSYVVKTYVHARRARLDAAEALKEIRQLRKELT